MRTMLLCDGESRGQIRNSEAESTLVFCWVAEIAQHGFSLSCTPESVHVEQCMEFICCLLCYAEQTLLSGYWALVGLHQANQGTLDPGPD